MSASERDVDGCQAGHRRVVEATLDAEDGAHQERRRAERQKVDGEPRHDGVAPQVDDHEAEDGGHDHGRHDRREHADAADRQSRRRHDRRERAGEHQALERDIEDAGALGQQSAERRQQDG